VFGYGEAMESVVEEALEFDQAVDGHPEGEAPEHERHGASGTDFDASDGRLVEEMTGAFLHDTREGLHDLRVMPRRAFFFAARGARAPTGYSRAW